MLVYCRERNQEGFEMSQNAQRYASRRPEVSARQILREHEEEKEQDAEDMRKAQEFDRSYNFLSSFAEEFEDYMDESDELFDRFSSHFYDPHELFY